MCNMSHVTLCTLCDVFHFTNQENLEHSHIIVIAVRAITSLLLNAMLVPRAGDTTSGQFKAWPRDKPICFLTTRSGHCCMF